MLYTLHIFADSSNIDALLQSGFKVQEPRRGDITKDRVGKSTAPIRGTASASNAKHVDEDKGGAVLSTPCGNQKVVIINVGNFSLVEYKEANGHGEIMWAEISAHIPNHRSALRWNTRSSLSQTHKKKENKGECTRAQICALVFYSCVRCKISIARRFGLKIG